MDFLADLRNCTWRSLLSSRLFTFILPSLTAFITGTSSLLTAFFITGTSSPKISSTDDEPTSSGTCRSSCARRPAAAAAAAHTHMSASSSSHGSLLRPVFDMVDADRDGSVSVDDVARHLAKLGLQVEDRDELKGLVESAAASRGAVDGGDRLDYEGFVYLFEAVCEGGGDDKGAMAEAFAVFDVDGDGFISVGELRQVLLGLGFTACHDEGFWHRLLTSLDSSLDGKIDFHQFRSFLIS